jgi:methenyltetrahydromethanopterin cyclohydrolase
MNLNERALRIVDDYIVKATGELRIDLHKTSSGCLLLDFGVKARGGLLAGLALSRVCMAGLADVSLVPGMVDGHRLPFVQVTTDQPVYACIGSQYAGWHIQVHNFYANGSGPMRVAYGKEEILKQVGFLDVPKAAVGVLECRKVPDEAVIQYLCDRCKLPPAQLRLLYAPTSSIAGMVQIVARSVETALHKLQKVGFELPFVISGYGTAPLPPAAKTDLAAMGRTNDAILYGGQVTLYVSCPDELIAEFGPRIPSNSAPDYGTPFGTLFELYNKDFYKLDPMLFSPAEITFVNLATGHCYKFGEVNDRVLANSFFGK